MLHAIEFKWNAKKTVKMPKQFAEAYPNSDFTLITKSNFWDYLV